MKLAVILFAAMGATVAGLASALEFDGAEISAETLGYSDNSDFGATTYSGSLQFGLTSAIGVAGNLTYYGFDALGLDARNATIHAIYAINPISDVGLYISDDSFDGSNAQSYGIEGLASFGGTTIEGYIAQLDGDLASGNMIGITGTITLFGGLSASASFDQANLEETISRASLGAQYQLGLGPTLYAEYGQVELDGDTENYLAFGARIAIGPNNGTTFGSRSVFDAAPGY